MAVPKWAAVVRGMGRGRVGDSTAGGCVPWFRAANLAGMGGQILFRRIRPISPYFTQGGRPLGAPGTILGALIGHRVAPPLGSLLNGSRRYPQVSMWDRVRLGECYSVGLQGSEKYLTGSLLLCLTTAMTSNSVVLIASPHQDRRDALRTCFEALGVTVEEAFDLSDTLDRVQDDLPQAVVVDPSLAETGFESLTSAITDMSGGRTVTALIVPEDGSVSLMNAEAAGMQLVSYPPHPVLSAYRLVQAMGRAASGGMADPVSLTMNGLRHLATEAISRANASGRTCATVCMSWPDRVGWTPDLVHSTQEALEVLHDCNDNSTDLTNMRAARDGDLVWVLFSDLDRIQTVARVIARLRDSLGRDEKEGPLAYGIALGPSDAGDANTLFDCAGKACDRARREGPAAVAYHNEAQGRWALERLTLEQSLKDAVANDELILYYQPRCAIDTCEVLGMEALIRWRHPHLGMISPAQFIPLAEETGLIVPIGEWVLREACRQNQAWRDAGLPPIRVSVNLSPVQFRSPDLFEIVQSALSDAGLAHEGLELEVTESMLMNDPRSTAAALRKLKDTGLHISIDDFGTGYSSLSYLKQFPIDALKIDQSFVRDVTSNPDDAAIATAIILMGHSLKLTVVAEGVETESQLAFLRVLQCNEIQGFLISQPLPPEKAVELLGQAKTKAA
jgi:EAL domain-containing protein (putative c-di-GMP-specific phosphodiesterase class I)/CheY-like chemotaxis protein